MVLFLLIDASIFVVGFVFLFPIFYFFFFRIRCVSFLFASMGLCAPMTCGEDYHFQCLFTLMFTYKGNFLGGGGGGGGGMEVRGFIDKVMKFQRSDIKK